MAIIGMHALMYSKKDEATRRFFRDVLGFPSVDAGRGWLIFEMPPSELAIHPTEGEEYHELYLMCDDIDATVAELRRRGVTIVTEPFELPVINRRLAFLADPFGNLVELAQVLS